MGIHENLDKFYTRNKTVDLCLAVLDLTEFDTIIEPSAGSGAFSDRLDCIAYDIAPENDNIIQADWFKVDKTQFKGRVLVVGNPPFGKNNKLSLGFFNESAKFADIIAFILPLSFCKDSIKNRLDLNFHLKHQIILDSNSYTLDGSSYSVPTVFQVWERQTTKRKKKRLRTTSELIEFTTPTDADISIRRVGGVAGRASLDLTYSTSSNYFIKNRTQLTNDELVDTINNLDFSEAYLGVMPSLSKGLLIQQLEREVI